MIMFNITLPWFQFSSQPLTKVEEYVRFHVCAEGGGSRGGGVVVVDGWCKHTSLQGLG